jgi:hypothetical protein
MTKYVKRERCARQYSATTGEYSGQSERGTAKRIQTAVGTLIIA